MNTVCSKLMMAALIGLLVLCLVHDSDARPGGRRGGKGGRKHSGSKPGPRRAAICEISLNGTIIFEQSCEADASSLYECAESKRKQHHQKRRHHDSSESDSESSEEDEESNSSSEEEQEEVKPVYSFCRRVRPAVCEISVNGSIIFEQSCSGLAPQGAEDLFDCVDPPKHHRRQKKSRGRSSAEDEEHEIKPVLSVCLPRTCDDTTPAPCDCSDEDLAENAVCLVDPDTKAYVSACKVFDAAGAAIKSDVCPIEGDICDEEAQPVTLYKDTLNYFAFFCHHQKREKDHSTEAPVVVTIAPGIPEP